MKNLSTLVKFLTVLVIGGGTIGASVAMSSAKDNGNVYQAEAVNGDETITRLWIGYDKNNPFFNWNYQNKSRNIKAWIHSNESGGDELVYSLGANDSAYNSAEIGYPTHGDYGDNTYRRYDYFDVATSVFENNWYLTIQLFDDSNNWQNATSTYQLSIDDACTMLFIWGDGTIHRGIVDATDLDFCAKSLETIYTCSNNECNGAGAFDKLKDTFFYNENGSIKVNGNLNDKTILDFDCPAFLIAYRPGSNSINAFDNMVEVLCSVQPVHLPVVIGKT